MLSEISTPEIDYSNRSKIMEHLNEREKQRQQLELESLGNQLLGKA